MSADLQKGYKDPEHLVPPPVHPSIRRISSGSFVSSHSTPPKPPLPKLPPRNRNLGKDTVQLPKYMPGSVEAFGDGLNLEGGDDATAPPPDLEDLLDEEELSEVELRELYDSEEIDRFLHIFQAYVSEVKALDESKQEPELSQESDADEVYEPEGKTDAAAINGLLAQDSLSAWFAYHLLQVIPLEQKRPPDASLKRLRRTAERTYLALGPTYISLSNRLIHLATWQDFNTSLGWCLLYWLLWAHGLLLPGLCVRVLFSLIRRRFLPYPTLSELKRYRREVNRAEQFSLALSMRLAASPTFGIGQVWQLYKDFRKSRKRPDSKDANISAPLPEPEDLTGARDTLTEISTDFTSTLTSDELAMTQMALLLIDQVTDLHERVKNLFLWRRPSASATVALILVFCTIFSALPATYLMRLYGLILGVLYWHVAPIIAAIPRAERMRLSPILKEVPTDAEYAMELISQRVARGLDVRPRRRRNRSPEISSSGPNIMKSPMQRTGEETSYEWHAIGNRAASAKEYIGNVKETFTSHKWKDLNHWRTLNPLSSNTVALPSKGLQPKIEARSYPAQYGKIPGLITLSLSELVFTSFASLTPKLVITLKDIVGAQKAGFLDGLRICWRHVDEDGHSEEKEEKFAWIGGRDELFTRLVGSQGRRWINVR